MERKKKNDVYVFVCVCVKYVYGEYIHHRIMAKYNIRFKFADIKYSNKN